jgi:hypothetical protein
MNSPDRAVWQQAVLAASDTMTIVKGDPLADRCQAIIERLMPPAAPPVVTTDVNLFDSLFPAINLYDM